MHYTPVKRNRSISTILIICIVVFFYLFFRVVSAENSYKPQQADACVILGHSLEDGNLPGNWLIKRLEAGLIVYNEGFCDKIIVTGGEGPRDNIAVGISMQQWLVDNGVNENDIVVESAASNTYENFANVKAISDEMGIKSIIVVTNDFHMYRSMAIGADFFSEIYGYGATVDFGMHKMMALLKEPLSLIKYYVFNKRW